MGIGVVQYGDDVAMVLPLVRGTRMDLGLWARGERG